MIEKISAELDRVVASQPTHSADRAQAQAAAEAFVGVMPDDASKDYQVSVSGSVGWRGTSPDHVVTSAGINVSASLVDKEA